MQIFEDITAVHREYIPMPLTKADDAGGHWFRKLQDEIFKKEEICNCIVRNLLSLPRISDATWLRHLASHQSLLEDYEELLSTFSHLVGESSLDKDLMESTIPSRLWHHGIRQFIEVLRKRLPQSTHLMSAYISIADRAMLNLHRIFGGSIWRECLGDLASYRLVIDDERSPRWRKAAISWYTEASDIKPYCGRLCHHLAKVSKGESLERLCLFLKSLTCVEPFEKARETMLHTIVREVKDPCSHFAALVFKAHCTICQYPGRSLDDCWEAVKQLPYDDMDDYFGDDSHTQKLKANAAYIAVSNIAVVQAYGSQISTIGEYLAYSTLRVAIAGKHWQSNRLKSLLPLVHVMVVFIWTRATHDKDAVIWAALCKYLNHLASHFGIHVAEIFQHDFPVAGHNRPLQEDFLLRGLSYTVDYFPTSWFRNVGVNINQRYIESPSTDAVRAERVLWVCYRITLVRGVIPMPLTFANTYTG
ncbi:MAG: hypothetical protein Q9164_006355 [Protoblastenia rupestris]